MSESRRTRRFLLRRGEKRDERTVYADNLGIEYDYKWIARCSSFYNIVMGCFRNGFPIVVPKLRYNAWAFYPFFFVRKDLKTDNPIPILNHERIHVRQQRDIHLIISFPLLVLCGFAEWFGLFNPFLLLCIVPFIPTIIYGISMLFSLRELIARGAEVTFDSVRSNTCFERESISRATNADYLFTRKFMAVLAYTGWKMFKNYGMKN